MYAEIAVAPQPGRHDVFATARESFRLVADRVPQRRVLALTGVAVEPGKLEDHCKGVASAQVMVERLGVSVRLRMWRATIAGQDTGSVVIGFEYRDLDSFVADRTRMQADAE